MIPQFHFSFTVFLQPPQPKPIPSSGSFCIWAHQKERTRGKKTRHIFYLLRIVVLLRPLYTETLVVFCGQRGSQGKYGIILNDRPFRICYRRDCGAPQKIRGKFRRDKKAFWWQYFRIKDSQFRLFAFPIFPTFLQKWSVKTLEVVVKIPNLENEENFANFSKENIFIAVIFESILFSKVWDCDLSEQHFYACLVNFKIIKTSMHPPYQVVPIRWKSA